MRGWQRGAAFIEALLMLSVFLLAWAGLVFLAKLAAARLDARAEARACVWQTAVSGCRVVPKGCANDARSSQKSLKWRGVDQSLMADSSRSSEQVSHALSSTIDGIFMRRTETSAGREVERPKLLGGEAVTVGESQSLPCNTRPGGLGDLAKNIFEDLTR